MRDAIIDLQSLCDSGHSRREAARIAGLTIGQVNYRLAKAIPTKPRHRKPALMRPCLCCQTTFNSEGPHNRLCDTCRRKSFSPYAIAL